MGVSVSTDAVRRVEPASCVANYCKCLVAVIEPDDVAPSHALSWTDIEPPLGIGEGGRAENRFRVFRLRFRQLALHVKHGVFHLSNQSGEDLAPRGQQARIWF